MEEDTTQKLIREWIRIGKELTQQYKEEITVMFIDVVNSTMLFEKKGAIDARAMIQEYQDICFSKIESHQGEKLKTEGDGIMVAFKEPKEAILAGVNILKTLRDYNKDKNSLEQIHVRIGINYGAAFKEKKDLYGDMVNIAARILSMAKPDHILITNSVYERLKK